MIYMCCELGYRLYSTQGAAHVRQHECMITNLNLVPRLANFNACYPIVVFACRVCNPWACRYAVFTSLSRGWTSNFTFRSGAEMFGNHCTRRVASQHIRQACSQPGWKYLRLSVDFIITISPKCWLNSYREFVTEQHWIHWEDRLHFPLYEKFSFFKTRFPSDWDDILYRYMSTSCLLSSLHNFICFLTSI